MCAEWIKSIRKWAGKDSTGRFRAIFELEVSDPLVDAFKPS